MKNSFETKTEMGLQSEVKERPSIEEGHPTQTHRYVVDRLKLNSHHVDIEVGYVV